VKEVIDVMLGYKFMNTICKFSIHGLFFILILQLAHANCSHIFIVFIKFLVCKNFVLQVAILIGIGKLKIGSLSSNVINLGLHNVIGIFSMQPIAIQFLEIC